MSDSRRTTRRAAHRASTRQTLRQQRGGAAWSAAAVPGTSEPRRAEWAAALAGTKFEGLASPSTAPAPSNRAEKEMRLELYFRCLEDLDGLFAIAVKLIKKSRGIADNAQLIQSIERLLTREAKTEAAQYIFDVVRFTLFTDDRVIDPGVGATKIQEILLADSDETLPMMLLYPERFSNVLLKTLGQLIIGALANPRMLQDAAAVESARPILAAQMESYAQSYAYTYTARPLRDGFYIGQAVREFRQIMMGAAGRDPNVVKLIEDTATIVKDKCKGTIDNTPLVSTPGTGPGGRTMRSASVPNMEATRNKAKTEIDKISVPPEFMERIPSVLVTRQNRTGKFWLELADEMVASLAITDAVALFRDIDETATAGCPSTLLGGTESWWSKLVARIYRFYALAPPTARNQRGLLSLLAGEACELPNIPDPDHEYQYSPDGEYVTVPTTVRGVEYGRLAKRMRTSTLQFILQLTFNIDKALAAAAST